MTSVGCLLTGLRKNMVVMDKRLDDGLKKAIIAYFEGFELVELLEIPIEDVVELLEEYIIDDAEFVAEQIGYEEVDSEED